MPAATKARPAPPAEPGPVLDALAAQEAAEADLRTALAAMAEEDATERRLKQELSDHPERAHLVKPQLFASAERYNAAVGAKEAAEARLVDARNAVRTARFEAARLPLPEARAALQRAEAALAAVAAEEAGLRAAQQAAAERGDVEDLAGGARRDGLPHRRAAAQMAVHAAAEQVALAEADDLDARVPALEEAVEGALPALRAAEAAVKAARSAVGNTRADAAAARQRARDTRAARHRLIDELATDRGPVVRSIPHAGPPNR